MLRVGLTGGIGSGKSTVAARLVEHGAVLVDADVVAREVVAPGTAGLAAVVAAFGRQVVAQDGSLDRAALGQLVFGDDARRAELNAIVHPLVRARTAGRMAAAAPDAVVVNDVPLLVETGLAATYDVVVVVDVHPDTAVRRLVEHRGMAEHDARRRIAAQATREQRRAVAQHVIDNSGTREDLLTRVDEVWTVLDAARRAAT